MTRPRKDSAVLRMLLLMLIVTAAGLASGRAPADDTLLFHAEGMRTGSVDRYAGGVCTFDGMPVPRASIYFIGLDAKLPVPMPQDPMRDEVHLRDGSVHPGPLVSIDADNVVTENAVHARREVAWIWLAPMPVGQGPAAPSTTSDEDAATYEWDGTVTVENRYDGEDGRHLWQAEYRVKFLEVPSGVIPGRVGTTTDFPGADVVPLDLDYEIRADQNWDRGSYSLYTNAAGEILGAELTMRGTASGHLSGDRMRADGLYALYGNIVRILTPLPATQEVPESLAHAFDYYDYSENVSQPVEPGWYIIYVGHFRYDSPQERRAYYEGIERGGREPPAFPDPGEDFLHWIPGGMHGESVIGRLDHPDQTEVRGRHVLPGRGPSSSGGQITIEWSFTRTPQ